eukprot:scaffold733_cov394-Pavlova_lutheri.AAC.5
MEGNENNNVPPNGLEHRGDTNARAIEREPTPTPPPTPPARHRRRRWAPKRHKFLQAGCFNEQEHNLYYVVCLINNLSETSCAWLQIFKAMVAHGCLKDSFVPDAGDCGS